MSSSATFQSVSGYPNDAAPGSNVLALPSENRLDPRPTVLVVDDTRDNIELISGLLGHHYQVKAASNGERALRIAEGSRPPDLILLDVVMQGLSGYQVCQRLKSQASTRHIPIVFLTANSSVEDEQYGLSLGAADYITKPISPPILLARVQSQLKIKAANDFLRDRSQYLEDEVERRGRELAAVQDVTIMAMASLAETRDNDTGNHILRTQHYMKALGEHLKQHPRLGAFFDDQTVNLLFKSAPLHDIGKVGIPDRILLKPGRFSPEEFEIMKSHARLGRDAIEQAERRLGLKVEFLKYAKEIAYSHQEKWDGSGYPEGLRGEQIPLSARMMAIADVYDALISRRVYKSSMPHERAVAIIQQGRGSHFDPDMVDAFMQLTETFRQISLRFSDEADQTPAAYVHATAPTEPSPSS